MPYGWIDPEVRIEFGDGRKVYYAYRNDNIEDGVLTCHFCLESYDPGDVSVDIELWPGFDYRLSHDDNIRKAYECGDIYYDEDLGRMCCTWDDSPENN